MGSFNYDDPQFRTGDYMRFENKGDNIAGTVEEVTTFKFDDKTDDDGNIKVGNTVPVLKLRVAKDQLVSVTCSNAHLLERVVATKPQIGDSVDITYVDDTTTKFGGRKKMFLVKVTKAAAPAADVQDPQGEPNLPF
jgi:hypothetical protein